MEVGRQIGNVPKGDLSAGLKYRYTSHDSVTESCAGPLAEAGIYYLPDCLEYKIEALESESNTGGTKLAFLATVYISITFIDTETGELLVARGPGMGIDTSDKAVGKAISYAVKYILLKALGLSTGDDPEKDDIQVRKRVTPEQGSLVQCVDTVEIRKIYNTGMKDLGLTKPQVDEVLVQFGAANGKVAQASLLPKDQLFAVLAALRAKAALAA